MAKAIDRAILRGLRLYRADGRLIRTGRELLSIESEYDPQKGGWYFPVEAEIGAQTNPENN